MNHITRTLPANATGWTLDAPLPDGDVDAGVTFHGVRYVMMEISPQQMTSIRDGNTGMYAGIPTVWATMETEGVHGIAVWPVPKAEMVVDLIVREPLAIPPANV